MGQWVAPVIDEIDPELRENIGVLPMPLKGVDEDNICYCLLYTSTDARSVYQGTGLGMAITKGLIEQMNGSIEVTSQVGVGSVFVITIPFEIAEKPVSYTHLHCTGYESGGVPADLSFDHFPGTVGNENL